MTSSEADAKILFRVEYDDGSAEIETLWAFNIGDDKYRLDNLPYFAYGVSWNDVVYAPFDADEEWHTFKEVVEKSGNRTIRIFFDVKIKAGNASMALLDKIVELGCEFENANSKLVVINIPANVDLFEVADAIHQTGVTWEYADPTYEDLFECDDQEKTD